MNRIKVALVVIVAALTLGTLQVARASTALSGRWAGTAFAAERCVSIKVRPDAMLVSSDVDIQIRVSRHEDHRWLAIAWDSDIGNAGSRTISLEGEHAPALFQWWENQYPPANYRFLARVLDSRGQELGSAQAQIRTVLPE